MFVSYDPDNFNLQLSPDWNQLNVADQNNSTTQIDWVNSRSGAVIARCKYKLCYFNSNRWRLLHINEGVKLTQESNLQNLHRLEKQLVTWLSSNDPNSSTLSSSLSAQKLKLLLPGFYKFNVSPDGVSLFRILFSLMNESTCWLSSEMMQIEHIYEAVRVNINFGLLTSIISDSLEQHMFIIHSNPKIPQHYSVTELSDAFFQTHFTPEYCTLFDPETLRSEPLFIENIIPMSHMDIQQIQDFVDTLVLNIQERLFKLLIKKDIEYSLIDNGDNQFLVAVPCKVFKSFGDFTK